MAACYTALHTKNMISAFKIKPVTVEMILFTRSTYGLLPSQKYSIEVLDTKASQWCVLCTYWGKGWFWDDTYSWPETPKPPWSTYTTVLNIIWCSTYTYTLCQKAKLLITFKKQNKHKIKYQYSEYYSTSLLCRDSFWFSVQ